MAFNPDQGVQIVQIVQFLSAARVKVMARKMLAACGGGRILLAGLVDSRLVAELRAQCTLVDTLEGVIDEVVAGCGLRSADLSDGSKPQPGQTYDVVVLAYESVSDAPSSEVVHWALHHGPRAIVVLVVTQEGVCVSRNSVDEVFLRAGARKHSASAFLTPYGELDLPSSERFWIFEPVPTARNAIQFLPEEVGHPDAMMDEACASGATAEALLARYSFACQFVRPGDRVLDLFGGLGAGARLISSMSRAAHVQGFVSDARALAYAEASVAEPYNDRLAYRVGKKKSLAHLSACSIDFCVALTDCALEYSPSKLLSDAFRILSPGGRLLICTSNQGIATTSDVRDGKSCAAWQDLSETLLKSGFLLERGWLQFKQVSSVKGQTRRFIDINPSFGATPADESCILALVMKSPITGFPVDRQVNDLVPNILAFRRDYENPELVRSMVSIGLRATSSELLDQLAKDTLLTTSADSADTGAALCVQMYRSLGAIRQGGQTDVHTFSELLESAEHYIGTPHTTPTGYRWRISLAFAAGLLWQALGMISEAKRQFTWVAGCDPATFSPLLGTKTVGATVLLGRIEHACGNIEAAADWWRSALRKAQQILADIEWREVLGDGAGPETFGMPELSLIMSQAGVAAAGLRGVNEQVPTQEVWKLVSSSLDDQLDDCLLANDLLRQGLDQSEQARTWLARRCEELESWIGELESAKQWLKSQLDSMATECERHATDYKFLSDQHAAMIESKAWLVSNAKAFEVECERREAALEGARMEYAVLLKEKNWLAAQVKSLDGECDRLRSVIDLIETEKTELQKGKNWLDSQVNSLTAEVSRQRDGIDELSLQQSGLLESKAWHESQLQSYKAEYQRQIVELQQLEQQRESMKDKFQAQVLYLQEETETKTQALTGVIEKLDSLQSAHERLEVELKSTMEQKVYMENNKWIRIGMKLGMVRHAGAGK